MKYVSSASMQVLWNGSTTDNPDRNERWPTAWLWKWRLIDKTKCPSTKWSAPQQHLVLLNTNVVFFEGLKGNSSKPSWSALEYTRPLRPRSFRLDKRLQALVWSLEASVWSLEGMCGVWSQEALI